MTSPVGSEHAPHESLWMRRAGGPRILVALGLTNLVAYAMRNALFTVYPDLRARFGLHDAKLGLLTTAFLIPHALATLPFGWAGDRFDRRRVIAFGMLVASIAGAAGAIATDMAMLVASRALVGVGTAAVVPLANSIIGQLYEGPRKASRMAIFNLGVLLGGVVGFGAGLALGFPGVVVALAIPGTLLALWILLLPVPREQGPAAAGAADLAGHVRAFAREARELLGIRTLRWLIASTTAMAFAAGGYNAWLIDFLERDKHMTQSDATRVLTVAMVGAVVGIIAGGRISDRLQRRWAAGRLWTIVLGMALATPCAIAAIELPPGAPLYVAGVATMFFMFWYHAPIAVSVDDLAPRGRSTAAQGLVIFTMHLVGTAPSSWVVGEVSDRASIYVAMWVPTALLVVAAACMALATPSFARDRRTPAGEPPVGPL
jgi:predicted MFS family arabinose efflux permease